jgi:hypothetical protein
MCSIISWLLVPAASREPAEDIALRPCDTPGNSCAFLGLRSKRSGARYAVGISRTVSATWSCDLPTIHFSTCRFTVTADDQVNPIVSTAAFGSFQEGHAERRRGDVDQQTATLIGASITEIG